MTLRQSTSPEDSWGGVSLNRTDRGRNSDITMSFWLYKHTNALKLLLLIKVREDLRITSQKNKVVEQSAVTLFMSQIYMSFDKTFFSESYCFIFIDIFCFEIVFLFCCLFCIRSCSIRKNNQFFLFFFFFFPQYLENFGRG